MIARGGKRFLAAAILCAGCAGPRAETVTVFAAASLGGAVDEVARAFESASGHRVRVALAASPALARQIEAGAPADVFISADLDWMRHVQARGLTQGPPTPLVSNSLVLVAPSGRVPRLEVAPGFALAAALGKGRLALGDPASVPAGRYARAALESLGAWDGVEARLAPAPDVRAALALVARGEAPLGIVYDTDARAEPRVSVVGRFPAGSHPPITYPMAVLRGAPAAATAFARFAASPEARATWRRHGFLAPGGAP